MEAIIRVGIGCIEEILRCNHCGEEYLVGCWDRTDGSGEYQEIESLDVCDCVKDIQTKRIEKIA